MLIKKYFYYFDYFTRNKSLVVYLFLLTFCSLSIGVLTPYLVKIVVDQGIIAGSMGVILKISFLMLVIYLVSSVIDYIHGYAGMQFSFNYAFYLKEKFIQKIYDMNFEEINRKKFSLILNLLDSDIAAVSGFCQTLLFGVIFNLLQFLGLTVILFYYNYKLAMITMLSLVIHYILIRLSEKKVELYTRFLRKERIQLNALIYERIYKLFKIKLFCLEQRESQVFSTKYQEFLHKYFRISRFGLFMGTIRNLNGKLGTLALLIIGGILVLKQEITIGVLLAFNNLHASVFSPASALINLKLNFHQTMISLKRLDEILKAKGESDEDLEKDEISRTIEEIRVQNLSFRFENEKKPLFQDLSFILKKGTVTRFQGGNGSGKTTLSLLLCGFYQSLITSGKIFIDNRELSNLKRQSLRQRVAYIMQNPELFSGKISELLEYSGKDFDSAIAILKEYGIEQLITEKGKEYKIADRNDNISGGEKQRLHLIEVLLRDCADIYIFDEPESSQDQLNRQIVKNIISQLKKRNKIIVLISHSFEFDGLTDMCVTIGNN